MSGEAGAGDVAGLELWRPMHPASLGRGAGNNADRSGAVEQGFMSRCAQGGQPARSAPRAQWVPLLELSR